MKKLWYVGLLLLAQESYAQKFQAVSDSYDDKIYGYEKNDKLGGSKTNSQIIAAEPVKEVVAIEPVKEVVAIEPVKEVVAIEPVKEVVAIEPVKEVVAIEPVKEVVAIEPAKEVVAIEPVKEVVSIDYQPTLNLNTNQTTEAIGVQEEVKIILRDHFDLKKADIVNIYGEIVKAGSSESVLASEQAKMGQFISISYDSYEENTEGSSDLLPSLDSK
jgi:hypothetical protein